MDDCESSFESKSESEKAVFYESLSYAIVGSMTGVSEDNIKNLTAYCIVRRLDTASVSYWRRLAELSSSMYVSYFVKVRNPKTNYQNLSMQLQGSVETGNFAKLLIEASTLYNIPAFSNVTSYNVTVEDKSPTLSPTSTPTTTPSSSPTTTPSLSPTTTPESSSRNDSTEAIIISILVLVACLIVVVVISVIIVILKITAVVIHPTVAAAEGGGGGGRYQAEDMI